MVLIILDIFDSFDRPAEFYKYQTFQRPNYGLYNNSSLFT